MFHLYLRKMEYLASRKSAREMRGYELLTSFHKIQDLISYHERFHRRHELLFDETIKKKTFGITEHSRQIMREKKLGEKNPMFGGLSDDHKKKISETKKRTNRGELHPMYNRKHRASSRLKTSLSMKKLKKRRWCLDPDGNEHLIYHDEILPENWVYGRKRNSGKTGV